MDMTKTERTIAMVALLALVAYVIWQFVRESGMLTSGDIADATAPAGTVPATPPAMAASLAAVADTGAGPSWLLYNAPGIYNMGPPVINTMQPPTQTQPGAGITCNACGPLPNAANVRSPVSNTIPSGLRGTSAV